jgi:hypothetical protein
MRNQTLKNSLKYLIIPALACAIASPLMQKEMTTRVMAHLTDSRF